MSNYDYDEDDFAPHLSEAGLDDDQLVFMEGDDGEFREMTVGEALAYEHEAEDTTDED